MLVKNKMWRRAPDQSQRVSTQTVMAQAPPTPPPTTAAELMDEVRFTSAAPAESSAPAATTSSIPASASNPPAGRPDAYVAHFEQIKIVASGGSIRQLVDVAQDAHIQVCVATLSAIFEVTHPRTGTGRSQPYSSPGHCTAYPGILDSGHLVGRLLEPCNSS